MRGPERLPYVKLRRVDPCTNMCRGRRSRPIMPAEAQTGLRPRTCLHVNASASGLGHLRACMSEADWRPR
eukprot:363826-Chlamydomonas_euryale.AAC.6